MTRSLLAQAINKMWVTHGAGSLEKNASAEYLYSLRKPQLDIEVFGASFCKMASAFGKDPWEMAVEVHDGYPNFLKFANAAGKTGELSRFYLQWANDFVKNAAVLPAAPARGIVSGVKNLLGIGKKTLSTPAQQQVIRNKAMGLQSRAAATKQRLVAKRVAEGKALPASMPAPGASLTKAQRQQMGAQAMQQRGMQMSPRQQAAASGATGPAAAARPVPAATPAQPIPGTVPPATRPAPQATGQTQALQTTQPSAPAPTKKKGFSPLEIGIGGAAIGLPAAGMLMSSNSQPQQPGY